MFHSPGCNKIFKICVVVNHLITMVMFTKGPCSLGEKWVALHADHFPIYNCKKCDLQLHSVVYCCGIPATEGGVPDAQGDSIVCHRCANMVKCASNNCLIKKNKVATAVFAVSMMNAKSLCRPPVPRHFCKKYSHRRWDISLLLQSKTRCCLF